MRSCRSIIAIIITIVISLSWIKVIDTQSKNYVDDAIIQSTAAFAIARGLNAIISTAQSTEVSFALAGGVAVTVGEVLDPINDLVEQYSSLMKYSIISLIIQKLLVEITSGTFFNLAITVAGASVVASLFYLKLQSQILLMRVFFSLAFIRFILVFAVLANGMFDNAFLHERTEKNIAELETLTSESGKTSAPANLSQERSAQLDEIMEANKSELANLDEARQPLLISQAKIAEELSVMESELDAQKDETKMLDRILRRSESINAMSERRKIKQDELNTIERDLAIIQKNHDRIVEENAKVTLEQQGLPTDLIGRTGQWFSERGASITSFWDQARILNLKEKLDNSVQNILSLMAIFFFKTLISPLLFLAALAWGAKQIWNVNLRVMFEDEFKPHPTTQHTSIGI